MGNSPIMSAALDALKAKRKVPITQAHPYPGQAAAIEAELQELARNPRYVVEVDGDPLGVVSPVEARKVRDAGGTCLGNAPYPLGD